jgi:hypothetical protein
MTRQVLGPEGVVPQDQVLTVSMDNSKPVLLSDFTNSFLSLADEYAPQVAGAMTSQGILVSMYEKSGREALYGTWLWSQRPRCQ